MVDQDYLSLIAEQEHLDALASDVKTERSVNNMEDIERGYPKFQLSVFLDGSKDKQYVIRANTIEEFKKLKIELHSVIGETIVDESPVQAPAAGLRREPVCETCGAAAKERQGINRSGKPYHAIFCSTDIKAHTKWL